jgi:site-specific recombinase XerD
MMSFETVSEEIRPFRQTVSSPISPLDSKSPQFVPSAGESALPESRHLQINTYLKKMHDRGLFSWSYVKDYLSDQKRRNCRPGTLRTSFGTLALFLLYLKERGHTGIETVTREDLSSYIEAEQDRGMKPKTVSTRLRHLYAFLRYLEDRGVVHPDIMKRKLRVKVPEGLPRAMDPEDVRHLLSLIDKPRDRAMILVLLRTGMRIGELLATRVSEVDLRDKRILIMEAQKTRIGRVVYLSEDACRALRVWLKMRDPEKSLLFYGQGRPSLSYTAVRVMFAKNLQMAGLSSRGYSLHCLRHTCASELLNAGMRLECLQQLLGHSSIEMTRRYARLTDNTRREEYFQAMAIIEKGEIYGHYHRPDQLPPVLEETELLRPYA